MRYAFARAGQYFFGWFIAVLFFCYVIADKDTVKKYDDWQVFLTALIVAALAGGYTFFTTWADEQDQERLQKSDEEK